MNKDELLAEILYDALGARKRHLAALEVKHVETVRRFTLAKEDLEAEEALIKTAKQEVAMLKEEFDG